jgi:hypothetical protein
MRITSATSPINSEEAIIWVDSEGLPIGKPPDFAWVRESAIYAGSRRGPIRISPVNVLLGYSTIRRGCQTRNLGVGTFLRRVFWRKKTDNIRVGTPCEAGNPKTIRPGVPGERVKHD